MEGVGRGRGYGWEGKRRCGGGVGGVGLWVRGRLGKRWRGGVEGKGGVVGKSGGGREGESQG